MIKKLKVEEKPAASATKSSPPRAAERAKANRSRLDAMVEVVKNMGGARPAHEVVREIQVVPTIFPILDWRLGVGGLPVGRIVLVHGPSAEGKTPFGIGLGRSFLERDHFFDFVDAERATDKKWAKALLGDFYEHPGFTTPGMIGAYEDVRAHARRWADGIGNARAKGLIDEDTTGVMLVDSIGRLMPKTLWDELGKATKADEDEAKAKKKSRIAKPKKGIDGMGGRAGQIKAAFNAAWLGELVPLCADTRTTVVIIARETKEEGSSNGGFFADDIITVNGGRALLYDSSLWLRVVDSPIYVGPEGAKQLVGFKHTVEIRRSKLGARREKIPEAAYFTSNGVAAPLGFDRYRDVLELGIELGAIEQKGSYYHLDGEVLGQGKEKVLEKLRAEPGMLELAEATCRQKF